MANTAYDLQVTPDSAIFQEVRGFPFPSISFGPNGGTNPTLYIDGSVASAATGIRITAAAAASGVAVAVISSGTNENGTFDAKGSGTLSFQTVATGRSIFGSAVNITSAAATAFAVGRLGTTTPAFQVDASATTSVTGLLITAAAAGSGFAVAVQGGNAAENLTIDAKGGGTLSLQATATGAIIQGRALVSSGALDPTIRASVDNGFVKIAGGTQTGSAISANIVLYGSTHANTGRMVLSTPRADFAADVARITITGGANVGTGLITISEPTTHNLPVTIGVAAGTTGLLNFVGTTSGTVGLTVAAVAGTWTMTLPAAVAAMAGYQLTDAAANGVCTWAAAACLPEAKNWLDKVITPEEGLSRIIDVDIRPFKYKDGMGTGDTDTEYVGPDGRKNQEFMHFYDAKAGAKGVLNPINTFGYSALAIKALHARNEMLEKRVQELEKLCA